MNINIVTIFPEMFQTPFALSIIGRAVEKGLVNFSFYNPRDFARDRHRSVDAPPFGGGAGMVMMAPPLFEAVEAAAEKSKTKPWVVLTTPRGRHLDQKAARRLSTKKAITIVCGRYAGVDNRFVENCADEEISIGDYVLSGGEIPAMVITDTIVRLLPDSLGNPVSLAEDSFSEEHPEKLQAPLYTRPAEYRGWSVPSPLLSGNHQLIKRWRDEYSEKQPLKYDGTTGQHS